MTPDPTVSKAEFLQLPSLWPLQRGVWPKHLGERDPEEAWEKILQPSDILLHAGPKLIDQDDHIWPGAVSGCTWMVSLWRDLSQEGQALDKVRPRRWRR